jgi:molybdopterin-guanine dinucleotide biosynthesis protein B
MSGDRAAPAVIGIAGWKKSGKTTLAVRLIEAFVQRGLKVASIKHAHHGFQVDEGQADSARHRRAGARQVAIVSRLRWALIRELADEPEPDFAQVIAWLDPCDLVIVEGYKSAPIPKLEVRRSAAVSLEPLCTGDPNVLAVAADHAADAGGLPVFPLDDIPAIADFIAERLGLTAGPPTPRPRGPFAP